MLSLQGRGCQGSEEPAYVRPCLAHSCRLPTLVNRINVCLIPALNPLTHIHLFTYLSRCVLGNTTILAEFASEEEINRFFAQGQTMATPSSGWQAIGSSQSRIEQSHPFPSRASEPNQWNSGDLHSSSLWGGPNYSSSLWGGASGTEAGRMSSPPISSFLPVDHLTGGGDSM